MLTCLTTVFCVFSTTLQAMASTSIAASAAPLKPMPIVSITPKLDLRSKFTGKEVLCWILGYMTTATDAARANRTKALELLQESFNQGRFNEFNDRDKIIIDTIQSIVNVENTEECHQAILKEFSGACKQLGITEKDTSGKRACAHFISETSECTRAVCTFSHHPRNMFSEFDVAILDNVTRVYTVPCAEFRRCEVRALTDINSFAAKINVTIKESKKAEFRQYIVTGKEAKVRHAMNVVFPRIFADFVPETDLKPTDCPNIRLIKKNSFANMSAKTTILHAAMKHCPTICSEEIDTVGVKNTTICAHHVKENSLCLKHVGVFDTVCNHSHHPKKIMEYMGWDVSNGMIFDRDDIILYILCGSDEDVPHIESLRYGIFARAATGHPTISVKITQLCRMYAKELLTATN